MNTRTTTAGAEHFALAMQSALTRSEVVDTYLSHVPDVIEAAAVGFYQLEAMSGQVVEARAHAFLDSQAQDCADFLEAYERYGRGDDPVLEVALARRAAIDSSRLAATRWDDSGARKALGTAGYEHSMEAPVVVCGMLFGTINFARRLSHAPFSGTDLASAEMIAGHLGRAIERAVRFETTQRRAQTLECTVDRMRQPVIVTDRAGALVFRNRAAQRCWPLYPREDGSLGATDPLVRAIADATALFEQEGKRVAVRNVTAPNRPDVIARTFRLAESTDAIATVLFERSQQDSAPPLPAWQVLTDREQQIAQLVSLGLTSRQIAERAFISENTVKQHLKRIFAKTNVSNRAELIQLIWTSAPASIDAVDEPIPA